MFKKIKEVLKEFFSLQSLWAFYLGASVTAFAHVTIIQWEFWAIIVPTVILNNAFKRVL